MHTEKKYLINKIEELSLVSQVILDSGLLKKIILLNGEVGAGKTELVKNLMKQLGCVDVQSPSYSLFNKYSVVMNKITVYHVDLYRLTSADDLESSGFWDLFNEEDCCVIIEWSQLLNLDYLPLDWTQFKVQINKIDLETREIIVSIND